MAGNKFGALSGDGCMSKQGRERRGFGRLPIHSSCLLLVSFIERPKDKGANNGNRKRGKISEVENSFKVPEEAAGQIDRNPGEMPVLNQ